MVLYGWIFGCVLLIVSGISEWLSIVALCLIVALLVVAYVALLLEDDPS